METERTLYDIEVTLDGSDYVLVVQMSIDDAVDDRSLVVTEFTVLTASAPPDEPPRGSGWLYEPEQSEKITDVLEAHINCDPRPLPWQRPDE